MSNKRLFSPSLLAMALASISATSMAEEASSLADVFVGGDVDLSLRYRYEFVDQDGPKEGRASTLKTRLTYKTKDYHGLSGVLEFDNNTVVGEDRYNDLSGNPSRTQYAVIADPTYTEINQAYVNYAAPADTTLRFGRQRINLDNQRFVGGVAWRNNEQTYDGFTLINKSLPDTTITLSNIYNINTITQNDIDGENHQLLHLANKSIALANVSVYGYLLEDINDTFGVRLTGKTKAGDVGLSYELEYAMQEGDGAADYDADYFHGVLGASVAGITAKLGYEVLGSDDGKAGFQTNLGTKHKFNGWADKFLGTPAAGLEDLYLTVSTKLVGPKIAVTYHQFDANEGGANYGDEIDLVVAQGFAKHYKALVKVAAYNADDHATDTTKVWLQLAANF
ncbi:lipoprotein [Oleiphilus messinensis]|uniref:Lipoprotein n=1 Tax=Oleiphilus messinensis TaxID=141451 RepID=A0A1Y0I8T0_9GAMM|nr:alginate export family protein [Oleiphilus messinensis]ARU55834.1 lipoprotein [Oleiphilus messinensis]